MAKAMKKKVVAKKKTEEACFQEASGEARCEASSLNRFGDGLAPAPAGHQGRAADHTHRYDEV